MEIAFLRAINVGGRTVKMEKLRGLFEEIGCKRVETFINSGNVIFTSPSRSLGALERRIEEHLLESLGYEVKTFVRTVSEVDAIARHQSFPASQIKTAAALNVAFMAEPLTAGAKASLNGLKTEIDDFHVNGREVYWLCRKRQSESRFTNMIFEKTLKVRATFRGINTVEKLAAKYARDIVKG